MPDTRSRAAWHRRPLPGGLAVALLASGLMLPAAASAALPATMPSSAGATASTEPGRLTNLSHLNFLTARVTPPAQVRHTTYRLGAQPGIGVLWVYASRNATGGFTRVGGGTYDAATNTYGQGAYDADDIARAAVVYLRHWGQFGDPASRTAAYQLLRGLTYLQDATGPDAGNVVLWMQPDGRLQRSATPADTPNPSDSGPSYWLARTIWALGEGYADFAAKNPAFARFLANREDLAIRALDREVLVRYGRHVNSDGRKLPAWLIVGGADASAEAVLGLNAYVHAGAGGGQARTALGQLSRGIAAMSAGDARTWPYGVILPSVTSISQWHPWAGLAPAALAYSAATLRRPVLRRVAQRDAVTFTSHLLIAGGPDNSLAPTPVDTSQIAYGADSRVESLQALADVTHQPAYARLAGIAASWFFGNNRAGRPVYDPSTGVTDDGVSATGVINTSSGAESTIHGLLTMLALDRDPAAAAVARSAALVSRTTDSLVEAESGVLGGDATVVTPTDPFTGESQWSGGAYVELGPGSSLTLAHRVPAGALLMPVTRFLAGSAATRWSIGTLPAGTVHQGRIGRPGVSPWPGALEITTLGPSRAAATGGATITVSPVASGDVTGGAAAVDAVLVQPPVETLRLGPGRHASTLVRSFARVARVVMVPLGGRGTARIDIFGADGALRSSLRSAGAGTGAIRIVLPAGGTALLTRS